MEELKYQQDDLICALATGWNASALGVIRTSGTGAVEALARIFSRPEILKAAAGQSLVYGHILDPRTDSRVDEVMIAVFRAPRSYTGEESGEITCHGGIPGLKAVLSCLREAGFRDAAPGEFTLRAFMNGKLDLTRAEAVHELVTARTDRAHRMALHRLSGSVETRIRALREELVRALAALELQLDYPEDEVGDEALPDPREMAALERRLSELADTFRVGRLYQEGVRIVLTGATNAGKSSLFNLFLKEERAIVSEIHGTTRDYLESAVSLRGIPVTLYDTAGLRAADNPVEQEGIRRSADVAASADLVLYLVDGIRGLGPGEQELLSGGDSRRILVWNKADGPILPVPSGGYAVSAVTGRGFPELEEEIFRRLTCGAGGTGEGAGQTVIDSERQKDLLRRAAEALSHVVRGLEAQAPLDGMAMDLKEALDCLGEITGEVTTAEILETMFSSFCVGK